MATQLSAVTMIGTTGQGATDGMRFMQFYFGLPLAMVILGVTLVPFLHGARVYTAYEYLERRFDAKTRSLTAFLFLLSRGMSCGTIIAAPAVVFSAIFGWNAGWCVALIGVPAVLYTMVGGVQAVTWVDVKQMYLIVGALLAVVITLLIQIPVSPDEALHVAGAAGRLRVFDFSFRLTNTYTFWSGFIGGTFLMLSYFGTDQSQVQRYLAAKSVDEARRSLLMSAYWKIPLQALVLLVGVLVFVFYSITRPPLLYNPAHERAVRAAQPRTVYADLERRYDTRRQLAGRARRGARAERAGTGDARVTGQPSKDVNYIIPRFVHRPSAARARRAVHRRGDRRRHERDLRRAELAVDRDGDRLLSALDSQPEATDAHFLVVSRAATAFWGVFACIVATTP